MYDSNNVPILAYLIISIIAIFVGKFVAWMNIRLSKNKKIFSKDFFIENKKGLKNNYICIIIMILIYCALLHKFGISDSFIKNLDLIKFVILAPMLVSSFYIDLKHRILPNRLNLTIFEIGLILTFIYGINNLNIAIDMLLGMFIGAGIFGVITILGGLIAGKEAMGLGDVKFMGAIGLYFGVNTILEISLLAFFIGAIVSIGVIIIRNIIYKSNDEYMPFGPFLAISSLICIFIPQNTIISLFLLICSSIVKAI